MGHEHDLPFPSNQTSIGSYTHTTGDNPRQKLWYDGTNRQSALIMQQDADRSKDGSRNQQLESKVQLLLSAARSFHPVRRSRRHSTEQLGCCYALGMPVGILHSQLRTLYRTCSRRFCCLHPARTQHILSIMFCVRRGGCHSRGQEMRDVTGRLKVPIRRRDLPRPRAAVMHRR